MVWPIELCHANDLDRSSLVKSSRLFKLFLYEKTCSKLLQFVTESPGNITTGVADIMSEANHFLKMHTLRSNVMYVSCSLLSTR